MAFVVCDEERSNMKKELTIKEARELFKSEKVFATDSGFIFNDFGKYCPNLTFVIDREFNLDENGKVISPINYIEDREVTDSFNLDLNGEAKILFGDFWRSQKGGACFRPKDAKKAKHILVRVNWGGAFKSSRGFNGNGVHDCGALYFRCASSNGGGSGCDYWILPVGYVHQYGTNVYRIDWETAHSYCARISATSKAQRAEFDHLYKSKLIAEEISRKSRAALLPALVEIDQKLGELGEYVRVSRISLDDTYFTLGYRQPMLYTSENLAFVQEFLDDETARVEQIKAERLAEQQKWEEFTPKFMSLQQRAEAVDMTITVENCKHAELYCGDERIMQKDYSYESLEAFDAKIREKEQSLEAQRRAAAKLQAEAEARAAGLPSDIRIWKRTGGRTGCSKGWVIGSDGVARERDDLFNENYRRAQRYDEGYEIWNQILPGELVIRWSKSCTAADHECEVIHRPDMLTEAQIEKVAEIQSDIDEEWRGLTGLASKKESPSIGDGWLALLV